MSELQAVARVRFHEGRSEEFKQVVTEILDVVREQDEGTLQYDVFLEENGSGAVFVERYRDSAAMIEHNAHVGELLGRMMATGTATAEIYGPASDELKNMLAGAPIRFLPSFASL